MDRDRQGAARHGLGRRGEGDGRSVLPGIDVQPFDSDGARRHPAGHLVPGPVEADGDIGAGTPIAAHGNVDGGALGRRRWRSAGDSDCAPTATSSSPAKRGEIFSWRSRRLCIPLVQRDLQTVRRLGRGRRDVPAGVNSSWSPPRSAVLSDLQAVAAPVDIGGDLRLRRARRRRCRRPRLWSRSPARNSSVAAAIPLIFAFDLDQRPGQPGQRPAVPSGSTAITLNAARPPCGTWSPRTPAGCR